MKRGIIAGIVLVVIGVVICIIAVTLLRFNFENLSTENFTTNTYEVKDDFDSISISANTEEIFFKPAADGKCRVMCVEYEKMRHEVNVTGGTLNIKTIDERRLTDHVGIHTRKAEITIYLPKSTYINLNIDTDTGNVDIPADFSFESVSIKADTADINCKASVKKNLEIRVTTGDLSLREITVGSLALKTTTGKINAEAVQSKGDVSINVDTGKVNLTDLTCQNLTSDGTTGDIKLSEVIVSGQIQIKRDTGDVTFTASDAETITVETTTGKVTGTLLTDKIFFAQSDTGKIEVPKTTAGGKCEITTDTGDIKIEVK